MPAILRPRPRARDAVLGAAALAALTLPDPARLSPARRHLLSLGSAALSGWVGWRVAQDEEVPFVPPPAFGAAAGAAVALALAPIEDATDRWLVARLRRAGVRHPRPVMALAAAGLGALAWAKDGPGRDDDRVDVKDLYREIELDPALGEIVRAMLTAGDPAAPAVLAQLESARAQALGDHFESSVMFSVGPDLPKVVPHTQSWPVRARWHIGEHPVELTLQIHAGRLDHVALMPVEDDYPEGTDPFAVTPVDDPDNTWPALADVRLLAETPEGMRPVPAACP